MDIRLPDPMTTSLLLGIELRRDILMLSEIRFLEDAVSQCKIQRTRGMLPSLMRLLRGNFSKTKIQLESTSAETAWDRYANTKLWALPKMPVICTTLASQFGRSFFCRNRSMTS